MAGLNNSIFDLPNSLEELRRPEDVIKVYTKRVTTKDGNTGTAFPGSDITFNFTLSANQHWLPSRSFFVIKDAMYIGVGNVPVKPLLTSRIAPAFNSVDNLWDGYQVQMGGFSLGNKTKLAPQIAACEKRLSKSVGYLDGSARSSAPWKPSFLARKNDVVLNGNDLAAECDEFFLGDDITIGAAIGTIIGVGTTFLTDLQPGDKVRFESGQVVQIKTIVDDLNGTITSDLNVAEANEVAYKMSSDVSNRANQNERLFQPSLGVFKQGKALPPARYEVILRPKPDVLYKQSAIECQANSDPAVAVVIGGGDRSPTGSNDLPTDNAEYQVRGLLFYVAVVENYERVPDKMSYVLDLEETEVLPRQIAQNTSTTENFTVSKSTFALSVALQDKRAGQNPLYSPSLFKTEGNGQSTLTALSLDYAGQTRPNPRKDMAKNVGVIESQDFQTWGWGESAVEDLAWYDTGGVQDKETWRKLGELYHFQFRKTGDDISTDVNVNYSYGAFPNGPHNLLLFHHFRRVIEFTVENNQVVNFLAQDA